MSEAELFAVLLLTGSAGGAWGARSSKKEAWRGVVVILAGMLLPLALILPLGLENVWIAAGLQLLAAIVVSSALGFTATETGKIIVGSIILAAIGGAIAMSV